MSINLKKLREIRKGFETLAINKYLPQSVRNRQKEMLEICDELIARKESEIKKGIDLYGEETISQP